MSDDSNIKDVAEAVKVITEAVPVYQDAIQPAAKEIGKGLQTIAKTVNVALSPLKALVWGYEQIEDYLLIALSHRLKNIPKERIVTPLLNIAGPALESLKYTGHDQTLRELYANLLATSMDSKTAKEAHPAFVEIIRQMTPDEAKIVKLFAGKNMFPLVGIRICNYRMPDNQIPTGLMALGRRNANYVEVVANYSLIGNEAGCEHNDLITNYIDNLCRLMLTKIPSGLCFSDSLEYEKLENHPDILDFKKNVEENEPKKTVEIVRKVLRVTDFGKQFCMACVIDRSSNS